MHNLVYGHKFKFAKGCWVAFLIVAHIALVMPLPKAHAMESANYKINQSSISSGGGKKSSTNAKIAYLNIAESTVENVTSANYKIAVGYINTVTSNPPVLNRPIPDQTMRLVWDKGSTKPDAFDLDDYFLSPDGSALTYYAEGNSSITISIDTASHLVSFSQPADFSGAEKVRFIARDENGNITKSNFVILIVKAPSNNPPVIYPIQDITANENELITVSPVVFDPDGDTLTLRFSAPFNDSGQWQTTYNDAGKYTATATVSDGTFSDSETFDIEVKNVNRPPVIETIQDMTVAEGDLVKLNVNVYDPDGDNVTVSYSQPFSADGSWQTSYRDAGLRQVTITASDGDLISQETFNIHVNNINASPSVRLYSTKSNVTPGENFTIYVLAQDPDGDSLKLTLKKDGSVISGCDNIILEGPTFNKTISIDNTGNHTIEAYVEEFNVSGTPNTASDSLVINVEENSSSTEYFPLSGDFNGDGLSDLGYYNRALGIWKVSLSNSGSFGAFEYWINESDNFGKNNQYFYPLISDFNGDGKTDVGFIRVPTSDGAQSYIRIATSTGQDFNIRDGNWRDTSNGSLRSDWHFITFTDDFNGDGLSDVGQIRVDDNQTFYIGLTEENLGVAAQADWINGGSHISMSDFSPLSGDFNGDGLMDVCLFKKSEGRWAVTLSSGDKFGNTQNWITNFGTDKDIILGDFNYDSLTDIGYLYKEGSEWKIKLAFSDGTKFVESPTPYPTHISSTIEDSFMAGDFNGDGLLDIAVFNKTSKDWTISLHDSKYPDLLVEIDNGIGGKTKITYKDSVQFDNSGADKIPDLPFALHVVSDLVQEDGLGNSYKSTYSYSDGFFEPNKREFRGFGYVKVIDAEGSIKETYFQQDDIFKGRPRKEVVKDKYEKVYSETSYNWLNSKIYNDQADFPYLNDETVIAYNPNTDESKSSQVFYEYDNYGNPTNIREEGFLDKTGDEKETAIEYYYDTTKWILSKPVISQIKDAAGIVVSAAKYTYDSNSALIKEEQWLGEVGTSPQWETGQNPTTEFDYDDYGNVFWIKDARGNVIQTAYDSTKTFSASVTNQLGHTQSFTYSKATGQILTSTDPNGQITTSTYDGFGRLVNVKGPGNISEVTHTYDLGVFPARITTVTKVNATETATAYSFIDGLSRQILSRIQAEYKGASKHIVTGEVKYDSRGQIIKKYLPYYTNPPVPENTYLPPANSTPFISCEYDAMGRLIKAIRPDNKASYIIYGVNTVESINENNQRAKQTKDAYGRLIEVQEADGSITNYVYDASGNLADTYDSASPRNHIHITYDTLGRKISMMDPDMGGFAGKSWTYQHDKVGNLISQTDAKGQTIKFKYDGLNRLTKKWQIVEVLIPPSNHFYLETNITIYEYDSTSKLNCIGRLSKVKHGSFLLVKPQAEFFYDELGREIRTIKTINSVSYTVERTYDSLDRLVTVKYPDETVVTYTYNKQGGIKTITGSDGAIYVSSVDYNANGQIERTVYGNGTSTNYTYNPQTLHLSSLRTTNSQLQTIQNLSYAFDPIGNVISILDSNYTNTQHFEYDNINRLVQSIGDSYGCIDYQYDSIGNILKKGNITMEYGQSAGPHAVTSFRHPSLRGDEVTEAISYDYNGNMTQKGSTSYEYDTENRLVKVASQQGGQMLDVSIDLAAGWNFFSLPFIPVGAASGGEIPIANVLSSIAGKYEQVSKYDTASGKWQHYVGNDKFNQFNTLTYGEGYLIYVNQACTLTLTGNFPLTQKTKDLKTGWNLICASTASEINTQEALKGVTYDSVAVHNGSGYTYNPAILQKGKAYWVHVNSNQLWNIPLPKKETAYTYDGDGGRISRTSLRAEGEAISTIYLGSSFELEGIPGQPADVITKHIFMGNTRVCSVEDSTTSGMHTYYYHQDHIGSSNVITDETGDVVNVLEYSPYGEVSRNTGDYSTDKRFTGKTWDDSAELYYYGARYYDPEIGRFTQADTIVPEPGNPQSFNRYSYCDNNPINYTDPTGHKKWYQYLGFDENPLEKIVGVAATIISIIAPPLAPAMMALNFAISAYTAIDTGNFLGFVGGIVGGAVFGAVGKSLALSMAARMGDAAWTFAGGAITGAVEFGASGFGAGFGAALASGGSFSDSLRAGGMGAAFGAATGAVIQGSYMAGWQDVLHGNSYTDVGLAQGNFALESRNLQNLPKIDSALRSRTRDRWGIYLHGTNAKGATGIALDGHLDPGSWVTKPYAIDPLTRKPAMLLNPSQYRVFTGIVDPSGTKGSFFALVVAPNSSAVNRGFVGAAPRWQIYGEHKVLPGSPYENPNN